MSEQTVVELMRMQVTDAYIARSELHRELRNGVRAGLVHQSHVDFGQGFLPKDFVWPEAYGDFPQKIGQITTAPPTSYLMPLKKFSQAITHAPVTEMGGMVLKADADRAQFGAAVDKMLAMVHADPGSTDGMWVFVDSHDGKAYVLVGWNSLEVCALFALHYAFDCGVSPIAETEAFKNASKRLMVYVAALV
ncbi:predicted protein [Sparassis crispa]|uniref:Uncharacterized protein n=1 Tax=Sparassis crispa TaxID=139825 RepID=A0A401GEA9_9APHY|nr:predicted protein [Sparassis crispa]GBE80524.1 predicted protein [Sparassis crispa]